VTTRVHDLAQANLSRLRYPPDAPEAAEFVAALDRVNWLAERSRGFVWRHRADSGRISLACACSAAALTN